MRISRSGAPSTRGPAEWFTGEVVIDPIAAPGDGSRVGAATVHFMPGARTAWHTHPHGQTIQVTQGVGWVQRRGGPVELVRAGDVVWFAPGEDHWHGATAGTLMVHVAIHQADADGVTAVWGAQVTEQEYAQGPPPA